jgi:hypothetical protein
MTKKTFGRTEPVRDSQNDSLVYNKIGGGKNGVWFKGENSFCNGRK